MMILLSCSYFCNVIVILLAQCAYGFIRCVIEDTSVLKKPNQDEHEHLLGVGCYLHVPCGQGKGKEVEDDFAYKQNK